MPAAAPEFLTSGAAARRLGVPEWWIARLYRTGALPEPPRVGRMRAIAEAAHAAVAAGPRAADAGAADAPAAAARPD